MVSLPANPVPETNPGTLPVISVLGGPDRDLSDKICAMTWETSGQPTAENANVIMKTWPDSRAGEYLHAFLEDLDKARDKPSDWLLPFFKQSLRSCSEAINGSTAINCQFLKSTTYTIAAAPQCCDYCPPESMFMHASIVSFFEAYQVFYNGITNHALPTPATIKHISSIFSPIDTSVQTLFSILGGILGSMSSIGWVINAGAAYPEVNKGGDAISLISSLISNTQLDSDNKPNVTVELSTS